ncbi:hypothetical protein [Flagellimonas sp.]|uniref:hypothetical protein n=1 Tax=Flagellimonas sp. TaxID=2058762 RepID=UPI003F4A3E03
MKSRKFDLFIVFAIGIQSLFSMASVKNSNACEYANSNMEYIKDQTETAISATELQITKYYAYKAINGIEKTRSNFEACGCQEAISSLDDVLDNLKEATRAETHPSSKEALQKALKNTLKGIKELEDYGLSISDVYGDTMLVLNTKEVMEAQGGILLPEGKLLEQQIHNGLKNFEISIDNIVNQLDCAEAKRFIKKTYNNASITLLNTDLTKPKKIYHQRVKTITKEALAKLKECE